MPSWLYAPMVTPVHIWPFGTKCPRPHLGRLPASTFLSHKKKKKKKSLERVNIPIICLFFKTGFHARNSTNSKFKFSKLPEFQLEMASPLLRDPGRGAACFLKPLLQVWIFTVAEDAGKSRLDRVSQHRGAGGGQAALVCHRRGDAEQSQ